MSGVTVVVSGGGTIVASADGVGSTSLAISSPASPLGVSVPGGVTVSAFAPQTASRPVSVAVTEAAVGVSVSGGVGPAAQVDTNTGSIIGVNPLLPASGTNITVSGSTAGYSIIGPSDSYIASKSPLQSVAGRTGNIVLNSGDISGLTSTIQAFANVLSVQGRTGNVVLSRSDLTAAAASHTHSSAEIVDLPVFSVQGRTGSVVLTRGDLTAAAVSHTHSISQISGIPVLSVQGKTGNVVVTRGDLSAASASHTHSIEQISGAVYSVQGKVGTVVLSIVDLTAAAAVHTHSTTDIDNFANAVAVASPVKSVQSYVGEVVLTAGDISAAEAIHTHSAVDIDDFSSAVAAAVPVTSVQSMTGEVVLTAGDISAAEAIHTHSTTDIVGPLVFDVNGATGSLVLQAGSNVSVLTSGNTVTISATGGGGSVSWSSVPFSTSSSGTNGDIAYDDKYFYVKSSAGWRRASVSTWTPLGAPTSVAAVGGDSEAVVSWAAPSEDGGYSIADYAIQYSTNSGSTWSTFSDGTSTATTTTVTGLTNGTAYVFRVAAVNAAGTGPYSTASNGVVPDSVGVVLLLHMDGSDGSTTFTDTGEFSRTATVNSAEISTSQSKFGGASGYFDGGASVSFASSASLAYGTGDFCIEFFVRFESLSGTQGLICSDESGGLDIQFRGSLSQLGLGAYGQWKSSFAWSPSVDEWYHVAVTRDSGTVRVFIDGSLIGTESSNLTSLEAASANCVIGSGDGFFNGWLDEIRITKGLARHTAAFSAPTSPFPDP